MKKKKRVLNVGSIGERHQNNFQRNLENHTPLRFIEDLHAKKMKPCLLLSLIKQMNCADSSFIPLQYQKM